LKAQTKKERNVTVERLLAKVQNSTGLQHTLYHGSWYQHGMKLKLKVLIYSTSNHSKLYGSLL